MTPEGGGVLVLWVWVPIWKLQPPPFWPQTAPVLPSPNLQPPLFMEAQDSPFKLSLFNEFICLFDLILQDYLFLEQHWMHTFVILCTILYINKFDSSLRTFIMTGQPLLFSNFCSWQPQLPAPQQSGHSLYPFLDRVPPPPPPPRDMTHVLGSRLLDFKTLNLFIR